MFAINKYLPILLEFHSKSTSYVSLIHIYIYIHLPFSENLNSRLPSHARSPPPPRRRLFGEKALPLFCPRTYWQPLAGFWGGATWILVRLIPVGWKQSHQKDRREPSIDGIRGSCISNLVNENQDLPPSHIVGMTRNSKFAQRMPFPLFSFLLFDPCDGVTFFFFSFLFWKRIQRASRDRVD